MDQSPAGRPPAWTEADAGTRTALLERLAPLRSAAVGGLGLAVVLGVGTVPVWQATDGTPWAGLVLAAATLAALSGAGLAEMAHRVCHALLAGPPRHVPDRLPLRRSIGPTHRPMVLQDDRRPPVARAVTGGVA